MWIFFGLVKFCLINFDFFVIIFENNPKNLIRKEDHLNKTEMEALETLTKLFDGFEFGILD